MFWGRGLHFERIIPLNEDDVWGDVLHELLDPLFDDRVVPVDCCDWSNVAELSACNDADRTKILWFPGGLEFFGWIVASFDRGPMF